MFEHVCRIFIDPQSSAPLELIATVSAGEQPNAERTAASSGQHIPDTVSDDIGAHGAVPEPSRSLDEKGWVRLCIFDLVAGDDNGCCRIDAKCLDIGHRSDHSAACCDCPGQLKLVQLVQEVLRARQRCHFRCE